MKRFGSLMLAIALLASMLCIGKVGQVYAADNAYDSNYFTAVTYQNINDVDVTVTFSFYVAGESEPITIERELAAHASASLNMSTTDGVSGGFLGSGVASSSLPIVATMVQICADDNCPVMNRPLSNGMTDDQGAETVLIATALKKQWNQTTKFSVQNIGEEAMNANVHFYEVGNATPIHTESIINLPIHSAKYFDLGQMSAIPDAFNGSVAIEATTGKAVAVVAELGKGGIRDYYATSFEGIPSGATKVYMPSALSYFAEAQQTSYAIQNVSGAEIPAGAITVTFIERDTLDTYTYSNPDPIPAAGKLSVGTRNVVGIPSGFIGSAVIESMAGDIVVIDKVYQYPISYGGISSSFLGAASGHDKLALPYVRWAAGENYSTTPVNKYFTQRTFIAIQNVGDDLPSNSITVTYVDAEGNVRGTDTIEEPVSSGAKVNTNAGFIGTSFGYKGDEQANTGGGAIIECSAANCQLIATARVASKDPMTGTLVGEDYNGIPIE